MLGAALDDRHMQSIDRAWQTNPVSNAWTFGISWSENLHRSLCCSLYGHEPPKQNTSRPVGEWNTLVVECRGPKIRIVHKSTEVIDFDQSRRKETAKKPLSGSISLQNHGSAVEFRTVRLTHLAPTDEPG